jgi:hypothetical protein
MALFLPAPRQWAARVFRLRAHSQLLGLPICQYRTHDGRKWTLRAGGSPLVATIHYKSGAGDESVVCGGLVVLSSLGDDECGEACSDGSAVGGLRGGRQA